MTRRRPHRALTSLERRVSRRRFLASLPVLLAGSHLITSAGRAAAQTPSGAGAAAPRVGEEQMENSGSGPIVLLGASYAGSWPLPAVGGRPVVNKGVAGQQSWEMLERFDRDVVALHPSSVILWGYINDVFRSPRERMDAALAKARDSFEQMIIRAKQAGIEPIVATEVTIRPKDEWGEAIMSWVGWAMGREGYQDYINGRVGELNAWLREFARREALLLLDLEPVLADSTGQRRKEFAKGDGSHITPEGYAALTAYAVPRLEQRVRRGMSGTGPR